MNKDIPNEFVVGFAFTPDNKVLLIHKLKPKWQRGLLNGIGGHMQEGETSLHAMDRECREEAGLLLDWKYRGISKGLNTDGNNFICHIFYAHDNHVNDFIQMEDETILLYDIAGIQNYPRVRQIDFLIHYGQCADGCNFMTLNYGTFYCS